MDLIKQYDIKLNEYFTIEDNLDVLEYGTFNCSCGCDIVRKILYIKDPNIYRFKSEKMSLASVRNCKVMELYKSAIAPSIDELLKMMHQEFKILLIKSL